jgi:hypothetical protein
LITKRTSRQPVFLPVESGGDVFVAAAACALCDFVVELGDLNRVREAAGGQKPLLAITAYLATMLCGV